MNLQERIGALAERDFRLVFSSTTISAIGDGVASIALVFAVLKISHNSPTAVGVVLAGLAIVYGLADGFVIPAQNGLIPAVISGVRLQQANALLGLSRSILGFAAPALGGLLVAAGSPGGAILIDAASFAVAAVFLARVRVEPRADVVEPEPFLRELREGWSGFRRQRWIFNMIIFFSLGNFAGQAWGVLAPLVMKEHCGGASTYGLGVWMIAFLVRFAIGVKETLIAAGVVTVVTSLLVLAQPVVWTIRCPALASA